VYFHVNFNVSFKLIKLHLLVSELHLHQNARCNDKNRKIEDSAPNDSKHYLTSVYCYFVLECSVDLLGLFPDICTLPPSHRIYFIYLYSFFRSVTVHISPCTCVILIVSQHLLARIQCRSLVILVRRPGMLYFLYVIFCTLVNRLPTKIVFFYVRSLYSWTPLRFLLSYFLYTFSTSASSSGMSCLIFFQH